MKNVTLPTTAPGFGRGEALPMLLALHEMYEKCKSA